MTHITDQYDSYYFLRTAQLWIKDYELCIEYYANYELSIMNYVLSIMRIMN